MNVPKAIAERAEWHEEVIAKSTEKVPEANTSRAVDIEREQERLEEKVTTGYTAATRTWRTWERRSEVF